MAASPADEGRAIRTREVAVAASAGLLLAVFLLQASIALGIFSATFDETTHLPSGYAYLKTGDLSLNPQHPPLVKMIAGLPVLFLEPRLDLEHPSWAGPNRNEWLFGRRFLYGNDADAILLWGRVPMVIIGTILGLVIFSWGREMFGAGAGLVALFLYSFSPNFIAHSRWVTMDVPLSCFLTLTFYLLWRSVRFGGTGNLAGTGLALGAALATKFSAILVLPAIGLLAVWAAVRPPASRRGIDARFASRLAHAFQIVSPAQRLYAVALHVTIVLLLAAFLVWACYLFTSDAGFYLQGIRQVNSDHRADYPSYLMGEFRLGGWYSYFLFAALFKTPVPVLLLAVLSVVMLKSRRATFPLDEAFLLVPPVLFFVLTSFLANNLGIRYVLPCYPFLFVSIGRLAPLVTDRRAGTVAAVVLALWIVFGAVRIHPDQLAYFNELAGGPAHGHELLDDSNIDWGQDLPRLARWQAENGVEDLKLDYFGTGSPEYYGIVYRELTKRDLRQGPAPGTYAISTHVLVRRRFHAQQEGLYSNWLEDHELVARIGYSFFVFRVD